MFYVLRQLEKQKQICFNVLWLGIIKLERCYIIGETIPLAPYCKKVIYPYVESGFESSLTVTP